MGTRRHGQGGGHLTPWKSCKVFSCIINDSKMLSRRILFMHYALGLPLWTALGTEAPDPLICPPLEINPAGAYDWGYTVYRRGN